MEFPPYVRGIDGSGYYKIVQVKVAGERILAAKRHGSIYHADILESILRLFRIEFTREQIRRDDGTFSSFFVPVPKGERYELIGAGVFEIDVDKKTFFGPNGSSYDYSIGVHQDFSDQFIKDLEKLGFHSEL